MANTTLSPYMSMPIPTVGTDPGPDWATNINASLSIVDQHSHIPGAGVAVTPAGLNINIDLPFGGNNATNLRTTRFTSQTAALSASADVGCLYEVLNDLYFNDGVGNQIRITQGGAVSGASGTITGLPSGTASASYSASTFTFQSATSTPATMAVGPLVVGNSVANSKNVTIAPNASIAANYAFTLPAALPASANYTTLDASGNFGYNTSGSTGSGAVVLGTSPTIATPTVSGGTFSSPSISSPTISAPTMTGLTTVSASGIAFTSGTLLDFVEGTWTPTFANISNTSGWSTTSKFYQRISNTIYGSIQVAFTCSSTTGSFSISLPVTPDNNFAGVQFLSYGGNLGTASGSTFSTATSAKLLTVSATVPGSGPFTVRFGFQYIKNN